MDSVQIPKGTFDILPYGADEVWQLAFCWNYVEEVMRRTASDYGYSEIRTPIYERTELFARAVGGTSDIVTKEMFTFDDRGGRSLSLRPEGTAAVMRAFVEHRLAQVRSVHKLFYLAPMFRYERPQSGRYRQHHQFGVEVLGVAAAEQDAEVIDLLCETYRRLGLKNLTVHLNSVGDVASRAAYREALQSYLRPHLHELSDESRDRFERNPLRILDSKDARDRALLENAPSLLRFLSAAAQQHFDQLQRTLDQLQISYRINDRIVRGLDYYDKTVFEVTTECLGAQNALGGGGRYDGLVKEFGGPDLPGIGFGTGLERILQAMKAQEVTILSRHPLLAYFLPLGEEARVLLFPLVAHLRHRGIPVDIELHTKKIQTGLQNAVRANAELCVLMGDEEVRKQSVQVKHLANRQQEEIAVDQVINRLEERWRKK
jgi:histidyl-tRNA synthetase